MEIIASQPVSSSLSSLRLALWVIIAAVVGDVAVIEIAGLQVPGYDWMKQSISLAGRSGSPAELDMAVWGVAFTALFYSYGSLLRRVSPAFSCVTVSSWLISIYAVCEGLGSGLFSFDNVGGHLTVGGMIHVAVGVIGNLALWAIPLALLPFFLKHSKRFYWGSIAVMLVGVALMVLFFISDWNTLADTFVANRGLWQRLFLLCSYGYLIALSFWLLSFYGSRTSRALADASSRLPQPRARLYSLAGDESRRHARVAKRVAARVRSTGFNR